MDSLIGRRFGRLVVVDAAPRRGWWVCSCECGGTRTSHGCNLRAGRTRSCGCLWRERTTKHGASGTGTYASWKAMVGRCTNPKDPSFSRYGGAGICVAPEWTSFASFAADMGERPAGTTLDRIDPFGSYCKANCRWANATVQARNQRALPPVIKTPEGQMRVCEASERSGLPANLIRARLRLNWPAERLFDPINTKHSHQKKAP